jgi:hypothetical protein
MNRIDANQLVKRVEPVLYALCGFAIAVLISNVAQAQSFTFLDKIRDFLVGVLDHAIWPVLAGIYGLWHLGLFAKTFQLPILLKGIGGAAAVAIWVERRDILSGLGVTI